MIWSMILREKKTQWGAMSNNDFVNNNNKRQKKRKQTEKCLKWLLNPLSRSRRKTKTNIIAK